MAQIMQFDHVGITVADLDTAIDFFVKLGLELEGRMAMEGEVLDTVCGIPNSRTEIAMLRTPGGGPGLELGTFLQPDVVPGSPEAMANEVGIRNVAFEVDDLRAMVDDLAADGFDAVEFDNVDGYANRTFSNSTDTGPSGTDRAAELVARAAYGGYDVIVNVQGDEPFITEEQVSAALEAVFAGADVGTVAAPVATLEAWRDPAVVKVVRREDGTALYFSRSPIPFERGGDPDAAALGSERYLRHIGVYAYTRAALRSWVSLPAGVLEQIERLEQLRPLAAGMTIGVGVVAAAENGVDTPADAARAEAMLSARVTN